MLRFVHAKIVCKNCTCNHTLTLFSTHALHSRLVLTVCFVFFLVVRMPRRTSDFIARNVDDADDGFYDDMDTSGAGLTMGHGGGQSAGIGSGGLGLAAHRRPTRFMAPGGTIDPGFDDDSKPKSLRAMLADRSLFIFSEHNFIRKYAKLIIEWGYPFESAFIDLKYEF